MCVQCNNGKLDRRTRISRVCNFESRWMMGKLADIKWFNHSKRWCITESNDMMAVKWYWYLYLDGVVIASRRSWILCLAKRLTSFSFSIMTLSKWFPLSCCQAAALLPQWRLIGVCACVRVCVLALLYFLLISTNCSFILSRSLHSPLHTDPQYQTTVETLLNWNVEGFWLDLFSR